jgi:hypothetical protein
MDIIAGRFARGRPLRRCPEVVLNVARAHINSNFRSDPNLRETRETPTMKPRMCGGNIWFHVVRADLVSRMVNKWVDWRGAAQLDIQFKDGTLGQSCLGRQSVTKGRYGKSPQDRAGEVHGRANRSHYGFERLG